MSVEDSNHAIGHLIFIEINIMFKFLGAVDKFRIFVLVIGVPVLYKVELRVLHLCMEVGLGILYEAARQPRYDKTVNYGLDKAFYKPIQGMLFCAKPICHVIGYLIVTHFKITILK
jgi:hypothetical protein